VLEKACGVKMIVKKEREIYYIGNVKFHIDIVPGLGNFVEIEAGNILADKTQNELLEQCKFYLKEFELDETDLLASSYSDMLLNDPPVSG
jgi:predicted adenylyl cyclase CyaB